MVIQGKGKKSSLKKVKLKGKKVKLVEGEDAWIEYVIGLIEKNTNR
jgi:hypothetical protein